MGLLLAIEDTWLRQYDGPLGHVSGALEGMPIVIYAHLKVPRQYIDYSWEQCNAFITSLDTQANVKMTDNGGFNRYPPAFSTSRSILGGVAHGVGCLDLERKQNWGSASPRMAFESYHYIRGHTVEIIGLARWV